jgi:predicted acetyltransferase
MPDYRPVPEDRAPDFRRIARYAFGAGDGPHDHGEPLEERRERMYSFGEERGMFDGDDLLVVCTHMPFTVRVRDSWLPLAGLSAVASPPENRRKGHVDELLRASLAEYRDREWPLSALHPFDEAFYERYGWKTCCRHQQVTVDVDALAFAQEAACGSFRRVEPGDAAAELDDVFRAHLAEYQLATDRTDVWWRDRVFQTWQGQLYGYAWERDGEVRGYVVYDVDDGTLQTHEVGYADHEAYLNLLRFCHDHDSQVEEVELHGPDHARMLELVADRGAVEFSVSPSTMVRIVDVPSALEAGDYPGVEETTVTLAVADDHAPWNEATVDVTVVDGTATVAESDAEPGATVDVGTLTQLYVGHLSVADARTLAGLSVQSEAVAATLDDLFPENEAYMPEGF